MSGEKKNLKKLIIKVAGGVIVGVAAAFFIFTGVRAGQFKKLTAADGLSLDQLLELNLKLKNRYPQEYELLQPLPYALGNPELEIGAESAILIDVSNGNILYEKNADEVIPPASMTKLFAMFVLDEEISKGHFHYDDVIPLPPECWACNMPPHSSLMFLGEGQVVTLEELILGLSICSGNDAAYALAYTVCGSMEEFVARMNQVAEDLGLEHTHFVESSGYSELNSTTAREMAAFCKVYLERHPDSLARFHSVPEFTYPKKHNMAPGDVYGPQDWSNGFPRHITMGITQKNTNPLLGKLEGCDGLKTGYIDESGYNLALTALRRDTRFLSVTMRGQGRTSAEGQAGRVKDGTALMDYAFGSFTDFVSPELGQNYFTKIYGATEKAVNLIPGFPVQSVCVPFVTGDSIAENLSNVTVTVDLPERLKGEVVQGEQYGVITVSIGKYTLQTIPLVADRSVERANFIIRMADCFIR